MDFSIQLFPDEIILKIFDYLNLGDLMVCALTCRRWHLISQDKKFLNKIELTIESIDFKNDISFIKLLIKSERKYLNLTLKSIKFYNYSDSHDFWNHFGHNITSLTIVECELTYFVFVEILKRLPHLKSLTINTTELAEDGFFTIDMLDSLYDVLNKITTFIIIYDYLFADIIFSKLLQLMPNIIHLTCIRESGTPLTCINDISWNCLKAYIIRQANKLKTLIIHGWIWNEETFHDLSKVEMLDLEELEIVVSFYITQDEQKLSNFIKTQKRLKILKITNQYLLDSHLNTICEHLKYLEVLEIKYCDQITDVGISKLHKLNNLKALTMKCHSEAIINGMKQRFSNYKNDNLKKLELNLYCFQHTDKLNNFCVDICKLYSNLNVLRLEMDEVKDVVLQSIFENLCWLRILDITRCHQLTDYGITGTPPIPEVIGKTTVGLSISRLKGLKHLRLNNSEHLTEKSFVEIVKCKELQVLDLECSYIHDSLHLFEILKQCGSLEILRLRNHDKMSLDDSKIKMIDFPRLKQYSVQ